MKGTETVLPKGISPAAETLVRQAEAQAQQEGVLPVERHLLLACLSRSQGFTQHILLALGINLAHAQMQVRQATFGSGEPMLAVVEAAAAEADRNPFAYTEDNVRIVGTTHILVALFNKPDSLANQIFVGQTITPERIYEAQTQVEAADAKLLRERRDTAQP